MADITFIGQMFFQSDSGAGWSEGWNIQATDYNAALTKLGLIAVDRLKLTWETVAIAYLRVSKPDVKRDTVVATDGPGIGPGTYRIVPLPEDPQNCPPDVAIIARAQTADPAFGLHYLHGVPEQINDDGKRVAEANWNANWATYQATIIANAVQKVKTGPGTWAYHPIIDLSFMRITRRKVGRPFGDYRGRSVRP